MTKVIILNLSTNKAIDLTVVAQSGIIDKENFLLNGQIITNRRIKSKSLNFKN